MKLSPLSISLFFASITALSAPAEPLWVAEPPVAATPAAAPQGSQIANKLRQKPAQHKSSPAPVGNLPVEMRARPLARLEQTSVAVVRPDGQLKTGLEGLKSGDVLIASIPHSVIAFPDEKAPVLAIVRSPESLNGLRLVGESRLERNSRRIFIDFTKAAHGGKLYSLKATGMTEEGATGFVGEYHSREGLYFAGDFISSFVAAYFDGLIPRTTNVFGQTVTDNTVDSAVKKGAASGAMSSAERFREKLKRVPEFSELRGPIEVRALIIEPGTG